MHAHDNRAQDLWNLSSPQLWNGWQVTSCTVLYNLASSFFFALTCLVSYDNAGKWKWSKVKTQKRRTVKWLQKTLNSTVTWPDLSTFSINFAQNTSSWFSLKWINWFRRTHHTRNVSGLEKYVKSRWILWAGSSKRKLHLFQAAERYSKRGQVGKKTAMYLTWCTSWSSFSRVSSVMLGEKGCWQTTAADPSCR